MSPKVRQTIYQLGTIVPALLGLFLIWGGIDQGAADSINQIIAGTVSIFGSVPPAIAATKVKDQRKDGTLDNLNPVDAVLDNIPKVIAAATNAAADLDRVRQTATDALGSIPVFGSEVQDIINRIPRY